MFAAGALLLRCKKKHQRQQKNEDNKVTISHQLTDEDAMFHKFAVVLKGPPITTLTWFKGDFQDAKSKLQKRMKQMVAKNPWLQGRISASSYLSYLKGTFHLSYTRTNLHEYDNINVEENFNVIDPKDSPLSHRMPIVTQNNTLLRSNIYMSNVFLRAGRKAPIFKATLIPCATNPHEMFALAVQLSHAAGDGATYYKLMHMLCGTDDKDEDGDKDTDADCNTIFELIPERIQKSKELQIESMGKMEHGYLTSVGLMCQAILGTVLNQLRGHLPYNYHIFNPRSEGLQMEKVKRSHAEKSGLPFVSTNDVLTSWLMTHCTSSRGVMVIDWRNRLDGHTDLHVGNYFNWIVYNKEDSASPGLIRKSLQSHKRVVTKDKKFPSCWEMAKSTVCLVTNWSTFGKENVIEGCVEDLHFPLVLADDYPAHTIRNLIIFRAGVDKIGLFYPPDAMSAGLDASDPFRGLAEFLTT